MSKNSNNFETPSNRRSRGLGLKRKAKQPSAPTTDSKVRYKSLEEPAPLLPEKQDEATTTPKSPKNKAVRSVATTSNCRPYNLALSKRVRESLTKRRLEFHLAIEANATNEADGGWQDAISKPNEAETPNKNKEETVSPRVTTEIVEISDEETIDRDRADLIERIKKADAKLRQRQEQEQQKRDDLQATIDMWRTAFVLAMDDLQHSLEPAVETSLILQNLQIPQEMLKYLNE